MKNEFFLHFFVEKFGGIKKISTFAQNLRKYTL